MLDVYKILNNIESNQAKTLVNNGESGGSVLKSSSQLPPNSIKLNGKLDKKDAKSQKPNCC
jgi:hypothetical protein